MHSIAKPLAPKLLPRLLVLAAISGFSSLAVPVSWHIDSAHSSAKFSVRHLMVSTVHGQFGGVTGTVVYDAGDVKASKVMATIDCTTVNTGNRKRDADLKTAGFFDIQRYPTMRFKSKGLENTGDGKLRVIGYLTINSTKREVILEVEVPRSSLHNTQSRDNIRVSASTKVSRKAFGLVYNPVVESGGVAVGDEVTINPDVALIRD